MDDSIGSADENSRPQATNLFNQINTNNWQPEQLSFSLDRSQNESLNESRGNISFDNNQLPVYSKIVVGSILSVEQMFQEAPQSKSQKKEPVAQLDEKKEEKKFIEEKKKDSEQAKSMQPPKSISSSNSLPSQVTITLYEQSICSKAYEQFETEDSSNFSTSLKSFLSLNDKNYRPHVKCMKFLYQRLKQYTRKSLENLKIYINFMEVKMRQEIQSLRHLDSLQSVVPESQEYDELNMDEKVILTSIKQEGLNRRQGRKAFYDTIKIEYKRLLECWRKIKERREKRERHIDEEIVRVLERIELEMEDMIICRLHSEKEKVEGKFVSEKIRSRNPYLTKDKYLEMKYLMEREKAYLKLITDFNGKVITYMVTIFSKEEPQIARTLKQALHNYAISYMNCYDHHNQILQLKLTSLDQSKCDDKLKNELVQVLLTMVPVELYNLAERKNEIRQAQKNRLEAILSDFSDCLQNTIFLTTIQMNQEFILYRNEATWKTSSSILDKDESSLLYENKSQTKFESKQALASNSPTIPQSTHKAKNMKLIVVLTSNYYLHLQHEDKIATLRLGDVKLSKKGRQIIICSKQKGIGGYLGLKRELGVLEFQSTAEVDDFAHKLSRAMSKLNI